jgi:2-polyprenyl-6-methoxyphenol hydroxylase-like FAD-dependent oxidoreductase
MPPYVRPVIPERTAVVVGGGIGGLTAAVALLRAGWRVTVLEQAPRFAEVGAGIALTANGLAALDHLGLGDAAREAGWRVHLDGTQDHRGRWLLRTPRQTGRTGEVYGIYRPELHRVLREAAAAGAELRTGARVVGVEAGEPGSPGQPDGGAQACVLVGRPDGAGEPERLAADLVVGADGLRSVVRSAVDPAATLRYCGMSAWRGIVHQPGIVTDSFVVRWGPGAEMGAVRLDATRLYWYGFAASDEGARWADEQGAALARFADWAEPARTLIQRTRPDDVIRHDVYSVRPLRTYVAGRVVLVGDAAHAMLPTMGQGANSSIEDGVTLGVFLGSGGTSSPGDALAAGLERYDRARRPRTQAIARQSLMAARFGAGLEARLAVGARNLAVRSVPGALAARGTGAVLRWAPPAA